MEEVFDTIDARIRRRLERAPPPGLHLTGGADREAARPGGARAEDSIEFLKKALEVARTLVQAERLEAEGRLDEAEHLLDPHIGALTQIVNEYKPDSTPIVVDDLVRDIDAIVKQVSYTGWNETQAGDRTVRREVRVDPQEVQLAPDRTTVRQHLRLHPRELLMDERHEKGPAGGPGAARSDTVVEAGPADQVDEGGPALAHDKAAQEDLAEFRESWTRQVRESSLALILAAVWCWFTLTILTAAAARRGDELSQAEPLGVFDLPWQLGIADQDAYVIATALLVLVATLGVAVVASGLNPAGHPRDDVELHLVGPD